jgi:SAM-dependent methyltransferase
MSSEALKFCQARGVENVFLHEADRLPFDNEHFDLVTAFDVIEHIEDDRGALGEFFRLLRPQGWLLVYTPALPWMYNEHDRKVHHKRRYVKAELEEKLTTAGFSVRHLSYVNLAVLPAVLLARLLFKLKPGSHAEMEVPPEPFNAFFTALSYLESKLVNTVTLPYGMTLVALAQKAPGPAGPHRNDLKKA